MAKLGDIFTLQMGKTPARAKEEYWNNGDNNWVSISDLSTYSKYVGETKETISDLAVKESGIKPAPTDTVIMSFKLTLGKTAITVQPTYTNEAIMAFIPNGNYPVHPSYFYHFFGGRDWSKGTNRAVMGTTLNKATLSEIEVSVPTLAEQIDIAERLDKVDTLISQRQQQLSKIDELVKSRFIELFGDPVNNPMGWHVADFSEYITFLTSGSRGWAQYFSDNGEYFITIKNVKNCRITLDNVQHIVPPDNAEAKRTRVKEGDLLISITADLGRTGVVSKEIADHGGYINQHLTCIRLDQSRIRPLYAAYFLESDAGKNQFQAKNQNGVKAGLNFNAINSLKLLVPPIEVQDAFISFVEQTDKLKFDILMSIKNTHNALHGRLIHF